MTAIITYRCDKCLKESRYFMDEIKIPFNGFKNICTECTKELLKFFNVEVK